MGPPRDRSNFVLALPPGEYSTLAYAAIPPSDRHTFLTFKKYLAVSKKSKRR